MDLMNVPLPPVLPECHRASCVDYTEKKGNVLKQLYFHVGHFVLDASSFQLRGSLIPAKPLRTLLSSPVRDLTRRCRCTLAPRPSSCQP